MGKDDAEAARARTRMESIKARSRNRYVVQYSTTYLPQEIIIYKLWDEGRHL
jgi:hypothetical protein